ncbi:hypothetical protein D3C71_1325850 [compost metagenome]
MFHPTGLALIILADPGKVVRIPLQIREERPAADSVFGDRRAGCYFSPAGISSAVFGQMHGGVIAVANAEQQHHSIQLVQSSERRMLAQAVSQLMAGDNRLGILAPSREGIQRMGAALHA